MVTCISFLSRSIGNKLGINVKQSKLPFGDTIIYLSSRKTDNSGDNFKMCFFPATGRSKFSPFGRREL